MATAGGPMFNLSTLIKRLEAATSRLEDIASSTSETGTDIGQTGAQGSDATSKATSIDGEKNGLHRSARIAEPQTPQTPQESLPPSISAFDTLVDEELKSFSDISGKLGDPLTKQCNAFCGAFKAQRDVLLIATKAKQPAETSQTFQDILADIIQGLQTVQTIREDNRKGPTDNHLSMISDGSSVLSWVMIKPSPDKHVAEVLGGAQYYGNKILSANKGKDTPDVDWVKAFVKLCGGLITYIKQHHLKGLEWNPAGLSPEEALKEVKSAPKANGVTAAGGPPPPPPPPPMPQFDTPPPPPQPGVRSPTASTGDMGSVFAELNRGESVTSGLKKVDKSQMTHKNPSLRAAAPVPSLERSDSASSAGRGKSPQPGKKPDSLLTKNPPKKELDGNKWIIENFEDEKTPVEIDAEKNQSILISRCKSVTIKVNGKANAISLDNSSKIDMLIESLVSSVDVINSSNFRMQVLGTLPAMQLDKVDGATVYLSKDSLNTEIYTSKCSSINITLPPTREEDDSVECPVPEQIKTTIVDGKLINEIVKQEG